MQVCRGTLRKVRLVDHMCQNLIFSFSSDASRSYCCRGRSTSVRDKGSAIVLKTSRGKNGVANS